MCPYLVQSHRNSDLPGHVPGLLLDVAAYPRLTLTAAALTVVVAAALLVQRPKSQQQQQQVSSASRCDAGQQQQESSTAKMALPPHAGALFKNFRPLYCVH